MELSNLLGSVVMYWLVLSGPDTCQADSLQRRTVINMYIFVHKWLVLPGSGTCQTDSLQKRTVVNMLFYGALKLTGSVVMYWLVLSGSDTCQADSLQKRREINMYIFVLRCFMKLSSLLVV